LRGAEWISGARFDAVRPVDLIERARCPLMIINSADDPFVSPADAAALDAAASRRGENLPTVLWRVDGAGHLAAVAGDPEEYRRRIHEFLSQKSPP
jgi:fermentation-respiration switch protein FrsA (DUF1100 family)